jgi:hypothetical protein
MWFGLERLDAPGQWVRCDRPEWGARAKWWKVADIAAADVARDFGAGTYRAVWSGADKRMQRGNSEAFDIEALPAPAPPKADAPKAAPVSAPESVKAQPKPPKAGNGQLAIGALSMPPPELQDKALAQVIHLDALAQQKVANAQTMMMSAMTLMLETERSRSREALASEQSRSKEAIAQLAAHYQALLGAQKKPDPALAQVNERLAELGQQLAELEAAPDDVGEQVQSALARLETDPSQLEVVLDGISRLAEHAGPVFEAWEKAKQKAAEHQTIVEQPVEELPEQ